MQFRNIFLLFLTGFILFTTQNTLAQKITTNDKGEKIILYPDGSWRYFDSKLDDVSDKYNGTEDENESDDPLNVESDKDQIVKDYRTVLINAAERAAADEKLALRNYEDVQFDRVLVEEELEEAIKNGDATKAEINEIKARLKEAEEKEANSLENYNSVSDAARKAEEKTFLSDEEIYNLIFTAGNSSQPPKIDEPFVENNDSRDDKGKKKVFASYNPKEDVMKYPPEKRCNIAFDGVDDFSGKKRKEVVQETLFSYTADEMRPYMKDKEFINCEAYLSSLSGGYKFLSLEITIASEYAQRDYGIIEKGSILNLKLMDDTNVKLFNNKTDVGVLNELTNSVTYQAQYVVSPGAEKILRKNEVDKVRVIWSSGYEDYEVYDLDFFINQFRCLNDK